MQGPFPSKSKGSSRPEHPYLTLHQFSTAPSCRCAGHALGFRALKTIVSHVAADEMFFGQLAEFCRLVQEEFLARFHEIKEVPTSSARALAFAETLMLCPTSESARMCIRRELP